MSVRRSVWIVIGVGLTVSLLLAGVVSYYASSSPDGLNKVAEDLGFASDAKDSATSSSPLAGYEASGVEHDRLAVGLAGVAGVLLTAALAFGLFLWLGRRNRGATADEPTHTPVA
ncbi:MAG TPA: PDGLE domain-containing protein [Candidatus Nanopelagicales bacterium]